MNRLVLGRGSLLLICVLCLLLCVLSFAGGLALGIPTARLAANAISTPEPADRDPGSVGSGRTAIGNAAGLAVGRQTARPVNALSQALQTQATRAGTALRLPPGINPAGFVNAEIDRQATKADKSVEALNDGVKNTIAEPPPPKIMTTKVASPALFGALPMFTLELGTFHTASDAQDLARIVSARGYTVDIVEEATADGSVVLRVHTGRFADRQLAANTQKILETQLGLGATIVAVPHPVSG